jgi:hypothetical protein
MEERRSVQNTLLWVVAVVLINALWLNVANQSAPNEINSSTQFQTYREIEISSVFGSSSAIPAELNTMFESNSVDDANVSFSIKKDNRTTVFSWSGGLNDAVPVWSDALTPGSYTFETAMDEGVSVQQRLDLKPFAAIQTVGHVTLTLLLVALAWGEQGVRALYARRPQPESTKSTVEKTPFKAKKFSPEDDALAWDETDSPWRDPVR